VRTFQIGFSSDNNFIDHGKGEVKKQLFLKGKRMNKVQSKVGKHHMVSYLNKKEKIAIQEQKNEMKKGNGNVFNGDQGPEKGHSLEDIKTYCSRGLIG
jgi:hypothetical protein